MNKFFAVFFLFCSNVLFGQQTIKNLQWINVDREIEGGTDAEGNIRPEYDVEAFGKIAWYIQRETGEEPEIWPPYRLPDKPIYYKVKEKDSLWKIASYDFIYGNPWLWKHLYEANKHNFINDKNPNLIEIGQTLIISQLRRGIREGTR